MKKNFFKILVFISILFFAGCTTFPDSPPIFEDDVSTIVVNKRRVLIINVDGAIGEVVREVMPTNISSLLSTSKYTFGGISDSQYSGYGSTWASLTKGVAAAKHHIEGNEFSVTQGDTHGFIPYFPSLFYRLNEVKPNYKVSLYGRDSVMAKEFLNDVEKRSFFTTDATLAAKVSNDLRTSPDMVTMVQFSSVMEAGVAYGFRSSQEYKDAITEVDRYVGDIVAAVRARETYNEEEWLIIVQSNNGGSGFEVGGEDFDSKNTFMILNYSKFLPYEFTPKFLNGMRIFRTSRSATDFDFSGVQATNTSSYDFTSNEMTVQFYIRFNSVPSVISNTFLLGKSRRSHQNSSIQPSEGWFFFQRAATSSNPAGMGIYMYFDNGDNIASTEGFPVRQANVWNQITLSMKKNGTNFTYNIYINGVLTSSRTHVLNSANARLISSNPFMIQHGKEHNSFHSADTDFAEVRIFDRALTDQEVSDLSCKISLEDTDSFYTDLIGYYPLTNLDNRIATAPDLELMTNSAPLSYKSTAVSLPCVIDSKKNTLISNSDVSPLTFYWLRQDYAAFGWSTFNPLKNFELEFLGSNN